MTQRRPPNGTFTVLFVCTGNICRSPMAERLSRAHLATGLQAQSVHVHSAGVRAVAGSGMHPDSALVLRGLGGDPSGFRARQFVDSMPVDADLTLTMTRQHRDVVLRAAPRALSRSFTLREAADLSEVVGTDVEFVGDGFPERARQLVAQWAEARRHRVGGVADDVPDPVGEPLEVHQQVGDVIAAALVPLLDRLAAAGGGPATGRRAGADRLRGVHRVS